MGEWNHYRVEVAGQRYRVWLNGEPVNDFFGDGGGARAGLVGVQITRTRRMVLGDRIVAVDGKPVSSEDDIRDIFEQLGVGATVTLTVARGNDKRDVRIQLVQVREGA